MVQAYPRPTKLTVSQSTNSMIRAGFARFGTETVNKVTFRVDTQAGTCDKFAAALFIA